LSATFDHVRPLKEKSSVVTKREQIEIERVVSMKIHAINHSPGAFVRITAALSAIGGMLGASGAEALPVDGKVGFLTREDDLHRKYAYGFDATDPDFDTTPQWVISPDATWYDVAREGSDPDAPTPELEGSVNECLLLNGTGACQGRIEPGEAYSGILTFSFETPAAAPEDGFLLFLSGLNHPTEPGTTPKDPFYDESKLAIVLEPSGIEQLETIKWTSPSGSELYYLGFRIDKLAPGEVQSLTFRYDVSEMIASSAAPVFRGNLVYEFVPEPGTGLLLAVGLAGLGFYRRR